MSASPISQNFSHRNIENAENQRTIFRNPNDEMEYKKIIDVIRSRLYLDGFTIKEDVSARELGSSNVAFIIEESKNEDYFKIRSLISGIQVGSWFTQFDENQKAPLQLQIKYNGVLITYNRTESLHKSTSEHRPANLLEARGEFFFKK